MTALDIVMGLDPEFHIRDVVDKLKIVRTFQGKLNGYNLDLMIPIEDQDGEISHMSAAQISGRTRQVINEQLTARESYLLQETGILTSLRTYLSVSPELDRHHVDDLFEELREYAVPALSIAEEMTGPMIVGLIFSRLKLRHFIENGQLEDPYFLTQIDFPMYERRQLINAVLRSGGMGFIAESYKARLMKYDLETLSVIDRRVNHYLTRLFSEIIAIRQGGESYLEMRDTDISRDDESRILRLLEQMESETPVHGDEVIFGLISDCYLQGFNLFK